MTAASTISRSDWRPNDRKNCGPLSKPTGVDKQGKQYRLDPIIDGNADLTDYYRRQQRTGDAAKLEFTELDATDPIPDRQR